MLETIRRNVRHPYIQILLGLVIIVFIFFFGWSMRAQKPTYVARVNGDTIDYRSYEQAYNNLLRFYREAYKGSVTPEQLRQMGLGHRALDQLIDRALLLEAAESRGLRVTDSELEDAIASVGAFQENGGFSKSRYARVLEANRVTPLEFETSKRQELLLAKLEQRVKAKAKVTDEEVEKEYKERNTKVSLEFASFRPESFEAAVEVKPGELRDFYETEKESFRTPEKRSARYVLFSPESFLSSVTATDDEARSEFNWRADEFAVTEAVRVRHILFRVPPNATEQQEAEAKQKAQKAREEILAGANFADVAKKLSEDPGTKDAGGELGYVGKGQLVPEFERAAFALKPGVVSEPVKTAYGYHLILVEDHRQAHRPSFDEVKDRILADIKHRKALERAYSEANNALMDLEDRKSTWDDLAKKHEVKKTPLVTREGPLRGVDKPREFLDALFALDPNRPGDLLETPAGTYLLGVAEAAPSAVPPFEEVKAEVEKRYRKAESVKLAEKKAAEFLETARAQGWADAIKAFGLSSQKTEPFTERSGALPKIGRAPKLTEAAFALTEAEPLAKEPIEVNGTYVAIRLGVRIEADPSGLEAQREKIRAELLPVAQAEKFQEFLADLRAKAKIEINERLVHG